MQAGDEAADDWPGGSSACPRPLRPLRRPRHFRRKAMTGPSSWSVSGSAAAPHPPCWPCRPGTRSWAWWSRRYHPSRTPLWLAAPGGCWVACSRGTGGATVGRGRRPDRRGVAAAEGVWEVLFGRRGTPGCLGRCLLGIRSIRSRFYPGHPWNPRWCRAGPSGAQAAPRPRSIRCPSLLSLRQTGGFLSFG